MSFFQLRKIFTIAMFAVVLCFSFTANSQSEEKYKPGDIFQDCDTCPSMIVVPSGSFERFKSESKNHQEKIVIHKPIAVGRFEVTLKEFHAYANDLEHSQNSRCLTDEGGIVKERSNRYYLNPGFDVQQNFAVVCISWQDVENYLNWINQKTGKNYRLLWSAEWEYVTSSGNAHGDIWEGNNEGNKFGIHKRKSDILEFVNDCYSDHAVLSVLGKHLNPGANSNDCEYRLARGRYSSVQKFTLIKIEYVSVPVLPSHKLGSIGFRVARDLQE